MSENRGAWERIDMKMFQCQLCGKYSERIHGNQKLCYDCKFFLTPEQRKSIYSQRQKEKEMLGEKEYQNSEHYKMSKQKGGSA